MSFTGILAGTAERYSLIERYIIAYLRGFSYYNSRAVVNKKASADFSRGMNLYPCLFGGSLRNISAEKFHIVVPTPVSSSMHSDGLKPRV